MQPLTKSQKRVFEYIQKMIQEKSISPTFREIQTHFELASLGSVHAYVRTLKMKGYLADTKHAGVSLIEEKKEAQQNGSLTSLPFIGYIAAGFPLETFPQTQSIPVPPSMVKMPEQTYLLRARGDTLVGEHILDGDLLLVEARDEASEGELIVATLKKGDTMVKKYYPEGRYIRLEGSDGRHQPIVLRSDELEIRGAVVGLIRGKG